MSATVSEVLLVRGHVLARARRAGLSPSEQQAALEVALRAYRAGAASRCAVEIGTYEIAVRLGRIESSGRAS